MWWRTIGLAPRCVLERLDRVLEWRSRRHGRRKSGDRSRREPSRVGGVSPSSPDFAAWPMKISWLFPVRRLLPRVDVIPEVVEAFPRRLRRLVARPRRVLRRLRATRRYDVARAVWEDRAGLHPHQELGAGEALHQGIVAADARRAVHAQ